MVPPALLPELPPELMGRIAREALAAEGSGVQAWVRLSRVCRSWRNSLRGVPISAVLREHLAPEQLRAALLSKPVASVTLHESHLVHDATHGELLSALTASAPQLTALHGLPVKELHHIAPPGLAVSSQLRTLTLRQTPPLPEIEQPLYADVLPAGLAELRLEASNPLNVEWFPAKPPHLVGFSALHSLRRLTLAGYDLPRLRTGELVDGRRRNWQLPHDLQVVRLEDDHCRLRFFSVQGMLHNEDRLDLRHLRAKASYAVTLEASAAIVTLQLTYALHSPDPQMRVWEYQEPSGTNLAWGFQVLRMETNWVQCLVKERVPEAGSEAIQPRTIDPLQALCRSLRQAPAGYHSFVWAPVAPSMPLYVQADIILFCCTTKHFREKTLCGEVAGFDSVAELADALWPSAVAEGLSVDLSPDRRVITLSKDSAVASCG